MKDTKTIQTLASVSLIGGPLSLIIGGVLLSTASLVCGIIALVMVRSSKTSFDESISANIQQTLMRQAIIGIAMCALALAVNAISLAMMMPAVFDAVQSGDYSSVFGGGSASGDSASSAGSSGAFGNGSAGSGTESAQSGRSSVWG